MKCETGKVYIDGKEVMEVTSIETKIDIVPPKEEETDKVKD